MVSQITLNFGLFNETIIKQKYKLIPMCDEFFKRIESANTRASVEIAKRNEYRSTFVYELKNFANNINYYYTGNITALEASKFHVIKYIAIYN